MAAWLAACGGKSEGVRDTGVEPPSDAGTQPVKDAAADAKARTDAETPEFDAGLYDPITLGNDAPELTKLGYYNDALGARIVMQGRDPNGDVASYTIKLFKGNTPALVDVNGDQVAGESEYTGPISPIADTAAFVYRFEPSLELLDNVDTIKVTVFDSGKRASAELTAKLGSAPTPVGGTSCDPMGFVVCAGQSVCTFNGTRTSCSGVATGRTSACTNALTLAPPEVSSVRAEALFSLWDAPGSCLTGDPKQRPDRVVKLRLAADAAKVTLSTANDYTNFDTSLYLLTKCQSDPAPCANSACACADDSPGSNKAVLTLTDVKANTDYFIVVDAFRHYDPLKHRFELTATVE